MKELENIQKDKLEIQATIPVETEKKFLGSIVPHNGHTLFEMDLTTGSIRKAVFESVDVDYKEAANGNIVSKKQVIVKQNCIYVSALNAKSSVKHFKKMIKGMNQQKKQQ